MKFGLQAHKRKILLRQGRLKRDKNGNLIIDEETKVKSVAELFGDVEPRELIPVLELRERAKQRLKNELYVIPEPLKPEPELRGNRRFRNVINNIKIIKENTMQGWKTWLAVISAVVYAVGGFIAGLHDVQTMITMIIAALATVGIGSKIDKAKK